MNGTTQTHYNQSADIKPETGSLFKLIEFGKTIKKLLLLFGRNTDSCIGYFDHQPVVFFVATQCNGSPFRKFISIV